MPKREVLENQQIQKSIKDSNKITGAKISYSDLFNRVADALVLDGNERETALEECYSDLVRTIGEKLIPKRLKMHSNPLWEEKYRDDPAMKCTLEQAGAEIRSWIYGICLMIDPQFTKNDPFAAKNTAAMRDAKINLLKSYNYVDMMPVYIKKWGRDCFPMDIREIDDIFSIEKPDRPPHTWTGSYENKLDVIASEYYYKSLLVQQELDSHGFFWKLVFYKYVRACEEYISKVDRMLDCIKFSAHYHDKLAKNILRMNHMRPIGDEIALVESEYKSAEELNAVAHNEGLKADGIKVEDGAKSKGAEPKPKQVKKAPVIKDSNPDMSVANIKVEIKLQDEVIDANATNAERKAKNDDMTLEEKEQFIEKLKKEAKNVEQAEDDAQQRKEVDAIHDQLSEEEIKEFQRRVLEQYDKEMVNVFESDVNNVDKMNEVADRINDEYKKDIQSKTVAKK